MAEPTKQVPYPPGAVLDLLVQHGCFAADSAYFSAPVSATEAEKTRMMIRAALRLLLRNGLVTVVPQSEWPEYVVDGGDGDEGGMG
jgi:hypothetical protein